MDLCATPAVELARLIRARELSAAELLAAVLARIADASPAVNAIVTLAAEQAAAAAAALDAQAARGSFAGPLRPGGQRAQPRVLLRPGGPAHHPGPDPRRPVRRPGRGGPDRPHGAGRRTATGRDVRNRSRAAHGPPRYAERVPRPAAGLPERAARGLDLRPG